MVPRLARGAFYVLITCVVGFVGLSTAQAVPVSYDEQVDGDLSGFGPFPIMAFDVGLNTVKGNFGFTNPGPTDWDSFAFSIPPNTELLGAAVSLSDVLGNIGSSKWRFRRGSNMWDAGNLMEEVLVSSPGVEVFTSTPRYPNIYNVSHISFGIFNDPNNTSDYEFSFRVEAVPEPSTAAFATLGFLVLSCGLVKRNRNRRA